MDRLEKCSVGFMESDFFQKYHGTYFSDSILKDVFGIRLRKHQIRFNGYAAVFEKDLEVMQDFIKYIKTADAFDEATKWRMLLSVYIDPDSKSIQYVDGIPCNADGLISLRRLYCRYGMTEKLVEDYRKYRAVPIIHFPSAVNGINMLRASVFGDRIDHTLYDLKRHCEGANDCRLQSAYRLPRTQRWLQFFHCDFGEIVKWMGIDGVFVGKENEVFDLESGDGKPVTQYKARYTWDWDDAYYEHLTNKILQFRRESRREKSRSL